MCWSFEVSAATYCISFTISSYLLYRGNKNDLWHSVFLFTFSMIQLLEAFIWLDPTSRATLLVWPVVIIIPLACTSGRDIETKKLHIDNIYNIIFTVLALLSLYNDFETPSSVEIGDNGHLIWHHIGLCTKSVIVVSYANTVFIPYKFMRPYGYIFTSFAVVSVIISFLFAGKNEFSTHWCHIANLYGFLALYFTQHPLKRSD